MLDLKSFWILIGGLASLFLSVGIKYALRIKKYDQEYKSISRNIQLAPRLRQHYGDVKTWLDENTEFRKYNFFSELFKHSLQPLIILAILYMVDDFNKLAILYLICILIFSFVHEITWSEKLIDYGWYRLVLSLFWLIFFLMIFGLEIDI